MAGLDPAIHVLSARLCPKTWMPGTSPGMTQWRVIERTGLPRQIRLPHQEQVDRPRAEPALADGPDDEGLAAAHVACRKHLGKRGLVVVEVGADVAALVEVDAERLQHALVHGM